MPSGLKVSIRVDGLTEARATVAALPQAFKDQAAESLDIGSAMILMEAEQRVPVDEGDLKRSLARNVRSDGLQVAVGSGDFKARFVEFRTSDTPAQPFLYPAFRIGAKYIRSQMREWAKNAGYQAKFRMKRGRKPKKVSA